MASIFGSALSYVQEKEEPVDFLDLFLEMDQSNTDLGVEEEMIAHEKQRKKVLLNPLNSSNSKKISNSIMSNTTNSFYPKKQGTATTTTATTVNTRLSPLHRRDSESQELFKTQNQKQKEQLESGLFTNLMDKRRLQQIEFLPTKANNFILKDPSNHQSRDHSHGIAGASSYSLKQGNDFLKKNFNLQIGESADLPKRYMVRKIKQKKEESDEDEEQEFRGRLLSEEEKHSTVSSTAYSNDNQVIQSLKNAQAFTIDPNSRSNFTNPMVNLNNLMASAVSPTSSMGSRATSERTFQIKKILNQNNPNSDHKKKQNGDNIFQNGNNNKSGNGNGKKTGMNQSIQRGKNHQNQVEKVNGFEKSKQQQHQQLKENYYDSQTNKAQEFLRLLEQGDQDKQLPLFSLNFNKTLETRMLLNSFAI